MDPATATATLSAWQLLLLAVVPPILAALVTAYIGHAFARDRAREDRRQQRLAETYIAVAEYVLRVRDWCERTEPTDRSGTPLLAPPPKPPTRPPDDELRMLEARVAAYGSAEIASRLSAVRDAQGEFMEAIGTLNKARAVPGPFPPGGSGSGVTDAFHLLHAARANKVLPGVTDVLTRMNDELAERGDRRWPWRRRGAPNDSSG